MVNRTSIGGNSWEKNPPRTCYDLKLFQRRQIPVDLVTPEKMVNRNWSKKPTGTNLPPLRLKPNKSDLSILEIGYDTEFLTPIKNLKTIDGNPVKLIDGAQSYKYLISSQFYVHYTSFNLDDITSIDFVDKIVEPKVWKGIFFHAPTRWHKNTISGAELRDMRLNFSDFIHAILTLGFIEGKLDTLPSMISLYAHFNVADIDCFKDLYEPETSRDKPLIQSLDVIRRTFTTRGLNNQDLAFDKHSGVSGVTKLRVHDTMNLAPVSKSLDALGELLNNRNPQHNFSKKKLGTIIVDGKSVPAINHMNEVLHQYPKKFYEYAIMDAEIPVRFVEEIRDIVFGLFNPFPNGTTKAKELDAVKKEYIDSFKCPFTLTSIGARYLKNVVWKNKGLRFYDNTTVDKCWDYYLEERKRSGENKDSINWRNLLGYYNKRTKVWVRETNPDGLETSAKGRHQFNKVPFGKVSVKSKLIEDTYFGGRNEQFYFGITPPTIEAIYDYDLVSAYPTALLSVGMIDWEKGEKILNPKKEEIDKILDIENYASFFSVKSFKHPEGVKYPLIPVQNINEDGIIFPLEGGYSHTDKHRENITYLTGIEYYTALLYGAGIEIDEGIIFPMDRSFRPFERFVSVCIENRRNAEFNKDELMTQFWKEMVNSLYGKTAQGISSKKVYSIHRGNSQKLKQSEITSFPIASLVTALVRSVLGMLMNNLDNKHPDIFIGNVTTDGFATEFVGNEEEWRSLWDDRIYNIWMDARNRMEEHLVENILSTVHNHHSGKQIEYKNVIEEKKRVKRYLGWRTRGQATLRIRANTEVEQGVNIAEDLSDSEYDELFSYPTEEVLKKKLIMARSGLTTQHKDDTNANIQLAWWFLHRFTGLKYSVSYINSLKDMSRFKEDAINKNSVRTVSMDFDFKRFPDPNTFIETEEEHICVLESIDYITQPDGDTFWTYFTANFVDVTKLTPKERKDRMMKVKHLNFKTKPLKDLDEYERLRKAWSDFKVSHRIPNTDISDEQFDEEDRVKLTIDREQWYKILQDIYSKANESTPYNITEGSFIAKDRDGKDVICSYNKHLYRIQSHLNNKGLMKKQSHMETFLNWYQRYGNTLTKESSRYRKNIGGEWDEMRDVVNALCLARKLKCLGVGKQNTSIKTDVDFALEVYTTFYTEVQLYKMFPKVPFGDKINYFPKLKRQIGLRIDQDLNKWKKSPSYRDLMGELVLRDIPKIRLKLEEIKNRIAPEMCIDVFLGYQNILDYLPTAICEYSTDQYDPNDLFDTYTV